MIQGGHLCKLKFHLLYLVALITATHRQFELLLLLLLVTGQSPSVHCLETEQLAICTVLWRVREVASEGVFKV